MEHLDPARFLGLLAIMLGAAKLCGMLARWIGQPSVLGELLAGVILGKTALGLIDPGLEVFHLLSELGVVLLLFTIGLETDLKSLLRVGPSSAAVAIVGVVLPFFLGYETCLLLGLDSRVAIVVGAALTATSVGITGRVLADLGQLHTPEGRIVLGAAIIDDVIGLVILTVVSGMTAGQSISAMRLLRIVFLAFGFLIATVSVGTWLVPRVERLAARWKFRGPGTILAVILAFALAWLADRVGSAVIMGAFAAGLLVARHSHAHEVEHGVTSLGHFFVPLFFVTVGAAVDVRVLNPIDPANLRTLGIAAVLTLAAVAGKFLAGFAPGWFRGNKALIGVSMIPRGEVGLIFAQMGLSHGILNASTFSALTLVVMATTFLAPPLLKAIAPIPLPGQAETECEGIDNLVTEA